MLVSKDYTFPWRSSVNCSISVKFHCAVDAAAGRQDQPSCKNMFISMTALILTLTTTRVWH